MDFQCSRHRREGRKFNLTDFRVGPGEPGHQGRLLLDEHSC